MSCELTEKVSLLIDGELAQADARVVERHLGACAECQQARADFLNLRRQISAYAPALNASKQASALAEILARQSGATTHGTTQSATPFIERWRARLFGSLAAPRFSPALATALALLVVACVVGLFIYRNTQRSAPVIANAPTNNKQQAAPIVHAPAAPPATSASPQEARASDEPNSKQDEPQRARDKRPLLARTDNTKGMQPNKRRPAPVANAPTLTANSNQPRTRREQPQLAPSPLNEVAPAFVNASAARVSAADAETLTAQHVEQAGLLLRAFRNARARELTATTDLVYEKRRARQLLYQNIVLRREAVREGDAQVATLLDSLEPILIDIANLPADAQTDDINAIKERMQRKNLVALLEVNSNALARAFE